VSFECVLATVIAASKQGGKVEELPRNSVPTAGGMFCQRAWLASGAGAQLTYILRGTIALGGNRISRDC
jgi:hypothetical protein